MLHWPAKDFQNLPPLRWPFALKPLELGFWLPAADFGPVSGGAQM
jgi:hypothetical protein